MSVISPNFDDRQFQTELGPHGLGYSLKAGVTLGNGFTVNLAGFSHRPEDTRTACFAAVPPNGDSAELVRKSAGLGAPLVFIGSGPRWEVWFQNEQLGPQCWWSPENGTLSQFVRRHRKQLEPRVIFRAKTLARLDKSAQLEFVDFASFRNIEHNAGEHITKLIHTMVDETRDALGWPHKLEQRRAQWIARANFWLLAGRILHDKNVPSFIKGFDITDVQDVFNRVRRHYDDESLPDEEPKIRIKALERAAKILAASPSLAIVSPETLAHPFENALITKETRKESGTHSTPGWLVEYMLGRLRPWIEELAAAGRTRVFEPACGHSPFLLGAMRTLASLPCCDGFDDKARHAFFKRNLEGCEYDGFAREVARLSLTLADVPNPNGWNLGGKGDDDLFHTDRLERGVKNADVVLCNPPFEADMSIGGDESVAYASRGAEIFRRTVDSCKLGCVIGFILPQTLLESPKLRSLRSALIGKIEWNEILRLPDTLFEKADVETVVLLGRRAEARKAGRTVFANVLEKDQMRFQATYEASHRENESVTQIATAPDFRMFVPDLAGVWEYCQNNPSFSPFGDVGKVGQGLFYRPEDHPEFPTGMKQISSVKADGYERGFFNLVGAEETHLAPRLTYMNVETAAIDREVLGHEKGRCQVVMNYAPARRGPWQVTAFLDEKGHRATSRFLIVRSKLEHVSSCFVWAVLNSPVGNAFVAAHCSKREILVGKIRLLPVPAADSNAIARVEAAARAYREAATQWTLAHPAPKRNKGSKTSKRKTSNDTTAPLLGIVPDPEEEQRQLLELKYLHWRMDAEVLALYNLPAKLERQLLDYFTGEKRVGVPFEQREYFPKGFQGADQLSELLAITADWPKHARRESKLIKKEYDDDGLPPKELEELEGLQRLGALHLKLVAPLDRSELDAEIARLKREGKWTE